MRAIKKTRLSEAEAMVMATKDSFIRYDIYLGGGFEKKLQDSFPMKDGRYAYRDYDPEKDEVFYTVVDNVSSEIMEVLKEEGHDELLDERYKAENEDFSSISGNIFEEQEDEECVSPFDRRAYNDWFKREMAPDIARYENADPRKEIVRMIVQNLSENEQHLFRVEYSSYMTMAEKLEEMNIPTAQAYCNRVTAMENHFRKIFSALGYKPLTPAEIRAEKSARAQANRKALAERRGRKKAKECGR